MIAPCSNLAGKKVLVVEDRYLLARDVCRAVRELGGQPVGPVGDLASAKSAIDGAKVDLVLLDLNLHDELATSLIRDMRSRGIAFVLATGYEDWVLPPDVRGAPRVEKPVTTQALRHLLEGLQQ